MKKIFALALVLALCLALGGCQSLTNFFDGFGQLLGGGDSDRSAFSSSESLPESSPPSSAPPAGSEPEPASSASQAPAAPPPAEEEPTAPELTLNTALLAFPNMLNGDFKEIFDPNMPVDAQIIMGGIPYLYYYDEEADLGMTIEFVEGSENLFAAWESAERRDGYMPGYNCFPDDCRIAYVILSGGPNFADFLFGVEGEKNYDTICQLFGQTPELVLDPADPPEMQNSEIFQAYDIQYCIFTHDGVNIRLTHTDNGGKFELTSITLYTDDPYGMFRQG